jgi:Tfp pilus assembly protein PilN
MITLNLLSTEQKSQLRVKRVYLLCKELIMVVLLFTAISATLLLISRYVLEQQLAELMERNMLTIHTSSITDTKIARLNKRLAIITKMQKEFYPWSVVGDELIAITPSNISYTTLRIFPKDSAIELQGIAHDRQALLTLKQSLEQSELFTQVELPLTALIERQNNTFTIKAIIEKTP